MNVIKDIMAKYDTQQINKIKDFLLSEIDSENVVETIDFVKSNDQDKKNHFEDILYEGNDYVGIYIEGNQYLISSNSSKVEIIDTVSEENGVEQEFTRIDFLIEDFIVILENKNSVLEYVRN